MSPGFWPTLCLVLLAMLEDDVELPAPAENGMEVEVLRKVSTEIGVGMPAMPEILGRGTSGKV